MLDSIERAKIAIHEADAILITAGAGMGVDTGLPDFRGTEGFWKAYPLVKNLGLNFEEMANPKWFSENPKLAWAFYGHRLNLYRDTKPHDGFRILLGIAEKKPGGYFVVTSNVDGQFQKAGFDERYILEKHGSIHYLQCSKDCNGEIWRANHLVVEVDMDTFNAVSELPRCPHCDALARPNILMFGDWHWNDAPEEGQNIHYIDWKNHVVGQKMKVVIIEMGAGTNLPSIRMFSERNSQTDNTTLIRINLREAQGPLGTVSLCMGALKALKQLLEFNKDNQHE